MMARHIDPKFDFGICRCGNIARSRCACAEWWCPSCLSDHTSAEGGRCPKVVNVEKKPEATT